MKTPLLACALAALLAAGCALTSKSDPVTPRYFSPERPGDVARPPTQPVAQAMELRLGHITSASYLDERLVYRDTDYELGYYQERRWTESPDQYLRRRLAWALFEERGLRHVVGGSAPTLEAELIAFEEVRAPKRVARVRVSVRLYDPRAVLWEQTLTVDQPVTAAGDDDAAVQALGLALRTVVERIANRVGTELAAKGAPAPASSAAPP